MCNSHLRLLYSSGRVALGKTQVRNDLGLPHLGNPRASAPSGKLQTMSEHHNPALGQLILHGGQRLAVSGHSQSLQVTGLSKSLPLILAATKAQLQEEGIPTHTKGTP